MQIVGAWFLISKYRLLQRTALVYFTIFHLYSGILVFAMYPTITLPSLLILYGPAYRYTPIPFSKKAIAGWIVIALVLIFQILGFITPGDRRITLEGNRFGMFMFEANHQCVATITTYSNTPLKPQATGCSGFYCLASSTVSTQGDQWVRVNRQESADAWNRCDPYEWWEKLHEKCTRGVTRISLTFDHSINGGPFYRIVDLSNICSVNYQLFRHNDWIMMPPQAQIVGYPVENFYR
jgi:hypothetical protein